MAEGRQIAVIGGGASGMVAAISAARAGADVVLVERMNRVGKKLLATGNGRCNLTNANCDLSRFHGGNQAFIGSVLAQFPQEKTVEFFENLGITCKTEDEGKIYPRCDQASAVLDVLRFELEQLKVTILAESEVGTIIARNKKFVLVLQDDREITAARVILASGGRAGPQFGSNGSGYRLAQSFGHHLIEPLPGIVSLRLGASFLPRLKGVRFMGRIEARLGDKVLRREEGEILFTDYGVSGPPVLQLSRAVMAAHAKNQSPIIALDLFPENSPEQLDEALAKRFNQQAHKSIAIGLVGLLNKRLIPVVLAQAEIGDGSQGCENLPANKRKELAGLLKNWTFSVTGSQSWHDAQVAAGGITVNEVNAVTLESLRQPGLYLCGEVLDVDGDCGGFNLQWAWSSGWVAGHHAALD